MLQQNFNQKQQRTVGCQVLSGKLFKGSCRLGDVRAIILGVCVAPFSSDQWGLVWKPFLQQSDNFWIRWKYLKSWRGRFGSDRFARVPIYFSVVSGRVQLLLHFEGDLLNTANYNAKWIKRTSLKPGTFQESIRVDFSHCCFLFLLVWSFSRNN